MCRQSDSRLHDLAACCISHASNEEMKARGAIIVLGHNNDDLEICTTASKMLQVESINITSVIRRANVIGL